MVLSSCESIEQEEPSETTTLWIHASQRLFYNALQQDFKIQTFKLAPNYLEFLVKELENHDPLVGGNLGGVLGQIIFCGLKSYC